MRRFIFAVISISLLFSLSACQGNRAEVTGRILFWHGWDETRAAALNDVVARFQQVYPGTEIVVTAVPANELRTRFIDAARQGFGPDLLLAPSTWLLDLVSDNLVRPVERGVVEIERFISPAQATVQHDGSIFGMPLAIETQALYYNTSLVDQPPATLDELLRQAADDGLGAAINTRFAESFWGIGAFGGQFFDADGRLLLDGGGYASWLNWLRRAQDAPGMVLGTDTAALRDLFVRGQVAYYVDAPAALPMLSEALGPNQLGVTLLPSGPAGPAAPLLHSHALLFSAASSASQADLAQRLAQFITNAEQSAALMRRLEIVPANRQVRVDPRAYPRVYGFSLQARSTVPQTNTPQMTAVLAQADTINTQVLAGSRDANEAVAAFTNEINAAFGFDDATPTTTSSFACSSTGTLDIWHSWTRAAADALNTIAAAYESACPGIDVRVTAFASRDLLSTYRTMAGVQLGPDLILTGTDSLTLLARDELVQPLTNGDTIIQRYLPATIDALRYNSQIYGLPISLSTLALYYNAEQITDPSTTLESLMREAEQGSGLALSTGFTDAWWGASGYGARLFDDNFRLMLADTGFTDWLARLVALQADDDIFLVPDTNQARDLFIGREVAYYVGPPAHLPALQEEFGPDAVGVVQLPAGPAASSRPWLHVQAFLFNADISGDQLDLARSFATFATNADSQNILLDSTALVPSNVNITLADNDLRRVFLAQARDAFTPPNVPQLIPVLQNGDSVYQAALADGIPPEDAVSAFEQTVNAANDPEIPGANQ